MDTLSNAQQELAAAQSAYDISEQQDGSAYWRSRSERHFQQAAIYAAVAQAEQMKRIAGALEESNARLERIEKLEAREQLAEEKIRVANEVMRHWGQLAAGTKEE